MMMRTAPQANDQKVALKSIGPLISDIAESAVATLKKVNYDKILRF